MTDPKEPTTPPDSQELEAFDVFHDTVQRRIEDITATLDELNEKSDILEFEWVFSQEDWHLHTDARYGRCRMIHVTRNEDGTYTVVAAKAWAEDQDLLKNGTLTPVQYVRYVSPKVQIAHFSQAATRVIDEQMGEYLARVQAGDVEQGLTPHDYLYEAAFGDLLGYGGVILPEVDVFDRSFEHYRDFRHLDIINQARHSKALHLNAVREPAWRWGPFSKNPTKAQYASQIKAVQQRTDIPELTGYVRDFKAGNYLIAAVKGEVARRRNELENIDDEYFHSPGEIDPELAALYEDRFQALVAEVEQLFIEKGYDPNEWRNTILKIVGIRIYEREASIRRETFAKPLVWSKQETVEALRFAVDDVSAMLLDEAVDDALLVRTLYGEMPPAIQGLYERMAALGIRETMSNTDQAILGQFVVLPRQLTVGQNGEVSTAEQPKTMRQWVEAVQEWARVEGEEYDYLFHAHIKPDGSILYAELRIQPGSAVEDIQEFARLNSSKVLLANFYPTAVTYLKKYHAREVLEGSDFHRAIHIKHFRDTPPNDGRHKKIEFIHNA